MSRQHNNQLRGLSTDQRTKNKTKKGKHHQEKRTDYNHLKTNQNNQSKNIDLLLNVATSMTQFVQRNSSCKFKSTDLKVMELIVAQLTFIKKIQEYEKEQNKTKVKQMRSHLQRIRQKRTQVLYQSQRINLLIRSGSPKNKRGLIACEMSPVGYGLIERKIEEDNNRQKTTFESIKRKQQCFKRLFEYFDKIFDKFNLQKTCFSFKANISRIQLAIEAITNQQKELKITMKENTEYCQQIERLKKQNEKLNQQNKSLSTEILSTKTSLQSMKLKLKQMNTKYTQLQQDFSLIVKQKLDAQTAFSKIHHQIEKIKERHDKFVQNVKTKWSQIIKQQIEQLKNSQSLIRRQVVEQYGSLNCQSVSTINTIIYRYTNELKHLSQKQHKLKRQIVFLQNQNSNSIKQLSKEIINKQNQIQQREDKRRSKLIIVSTYSQAHYSKIVKKFEFCTIPQFCYVPIDKIAFSPTQQLHIDSKVYQICTKPKQNRLSLSLGQLSINSSFQKQIINKSSQTQDEIPPILKRNNMQVQTNKLEIQQKCVQTQMQDSSIQSQAKSNLVCLRAYSMTCLTPLFKQNIAVATETKYLSIFKAYNQFIQTNIQTQQQSTGTQMVQRQQSSTNTELNQVTRDENIPNQTKEQGVNTEQCSYEEDDLQYIQQHIQQLSCKKRQENKEQHTVFSLLLQAEQCIMVPEIYVLKQEIQICRNQIDHLKKKCISLQKQREADQQNVFQFCY